MNLELFIAKRIHFKGQGKKAVSRPAVRVAMLGIALGLAIMLIAVSVVVGFKSEIRNKVIAFGSHIQITNFDSNQTYETKPITVSDSLLQNLQQTDGVRHIQRFATKPGIIKTDDEVQGIVLKGIDPYFDWTFYKSNFTAGTTLALNDSVVSRDAIISDYLAKLLRLNIGDSFLTYFMQDESVRARKFTVVGLYSTHFTDYDKMFILTDIQQIQQLNAWEENQVSGLEVLVKDYNQLNTVADNLYHKLVPLSADANNSAMQPLTIEELNPQIFSWLSMLDRNVWVILILMLLVAGFNMISGLLILILERTNMIGILKAMGAQNWSIRKIFLYHSFFLIGKGMLWGNIIGLSLILIQYFTHIIPLDAANYYVAYVPVSFNIWHILLINIGAFTGSVLMLILPSVIISKILPAKSIRFE